MATLNKIGITTGNTVEAYHVSQSIDAFTGIVEYDIALSGSFNLTGSMTIDGLATPIVPNIITFDPSTNVLHTTSSIGFLQPLSSSISNLSSSISSILTSSGNFANTDLTFTGDRTHFLNNNYLFITDAFIPTSSFLYLDVVAQETQIGLGNSYLSFDSTTIDFIQSGSSRVEINSTETIINGYDFRVKGDTDNVLLYVDASTDRVAIGKNTPNAKLDVNGNTIITGSLDVSGSLRIGETILNNTLDDILVVDGNGVVHKRDSSTISSSKPPLYIYAGSNSATKTINGVGIGKSSSGASNPGLISSTSLTMEVTKSLSEGDQIIWNTKISEDNITGFKLSYEGVYLIGTSIAYAPIIESDLSTNLGSPNKVLFELEMIKFSDIGTDKFRFNLKQTNYYDPSNILGNGDPVTTIEDDVRYSIPNTSIAANNTLNSPQQVLTFDTFIQTIPVGQISNVKFELAKSGGGPFGVDSSYCRLIQA
jgi:hypothetical protein